MSDHQDLTFSPELRLQEEENIRLFHRVEDLLGPAGAPALHKLADAIWGEAERDSYEQGYGAALADIKRGRPLDDRARS